MGLWGDDANTDVDGISFNPSTDRVNYSFFLIDAAGNKLGNRDVTYDVDVYVNGQRVSSSVDDVENVSNSRGLVSGELYVAAEADDVVEGRNPQCGHCWYHSRARRGYDCPLRQGRLPAVC